MVASLANISRSSNVLGFSLYACLRGTAGNLALSPASISIALAMAWGGARGATSEEMRRALQLSGSPDEVMRDAGWLAASLTDPSLPLKLRIANRLFGERTYALEPAYLEATARAFGAAFEGVDFRHASAAARERINGWVEQQTEQRIRGLVPEGALDAETRLVIVNAIYFLAKWAQPFEPFATRPRPFFVTPTESKDVPTMHQQASLAYLEQPDLRAVELPYRGGAMTMLFVAPAARGDLPLLERSLDAARLDAIARALEPQLVLLGLPKFEVNPLAALDLADALAEMGMPQAFDPKRADFTGIANPPDPDDRLYVGDVFHKAFVRVDEEGTEAAAATAMTMPRAAGMPPKATQFDLDRPFLFFIRHPASGLVLFMGRVADPTLA